MALKNLRLKNFKGTYEASYPLPQAASIRGRNGTGKTTLKEAICFVFAGTDACGLRSPVHLITKGKEEAEVEITTDKATLYRKITQKGVGQIRLTVSGVVTPITQSQLETMVGSPDVFLSVFLPGYFMTLANEKQQKVLQELLPPVDRRGIFEELSGFRLDDEEVLKYGLHRRIDLVASSLSQARRELEKEAARVEGQIEGMTSFDEMEQPAEPQEAVKTLNKQTLLKQLWEEYKSRQEHHFLEEIKKLRAKYKPQPGQPVLAQEISSDNCMMCGQIVGSKHREKISRLNQEAREAYEKRLVEIRAYNADIDKQIDESERKLFSVRRSNGAFLPGAPIEQYDPFVHQRAQEEVRAFMSQESAYKIYLDQRQKAQVGLDELKSRAALYGQRVARLRVLEARVWDLPRVELERQQEMLKMPNNTLVIGEQLQLVWKGLDYYALSTGQKMRASIELSQKFNSLMKKPLNTIFVDDAELMDTDEVYDSSEVQWLVCKVDPAVESLQIKALR